MTYPAIPPLGESWPLPPANEIGLDPDGVRAWEVLLSAERAAPKPAAKYQDEVIAIRLVAWLVKDLYEHRRSDAYKRLTRQILSCNDVLSNLQQRHANVFQLSLDLRNRLFRVFCSRTERTPTPSPPPRTSGSRPSYEKHRADILRSMAAARSEDGRTHSQAKADALLRDGYKCVLTGLYDKDTLMSVLELNTKSDEEGVGCVDTEVAHLFSGSGTHHEAATSILDTFGLRSLAPKLQGNRVNNLFNVITMSVPLHNDFDQLLFWLEPVPGTEHTYTVVARHPPTFFKQMPKPPREVTFRVDRDAANGIELPPPDPELLAIRAACARAAAMSGAADQMRLLREEQQQNDAGTLADSESAIHLLDSLLCAVSDRDASCGQAVGVGG